MPPSHPPVGENRSATMVLILLLGIGLIVYRNGRPAVAVQHGHNNHPHAHKQTWGHDTRATTTATPATTTATTTATTATTATPVALEVYRDECFHFTVADGVVYGRGLRRHSSDETEFTEMDLTMQVLIPDRGPRGASSSPEDGAGAGAEDPSSAPAPQRPAILMVHGGCFSLGNNHMLDRNARWYAGRGFNVFSVNYRHMASKDCPTTDPTWGNVPKGWAPITCRVAGCAGCNWCPESVYPPMRDVAAAVRFIRATTGTYGTDPARIAAYGFSAGGVAVVSLGLLLAGDYTAELSETEDPTLATTHLGYPSSVAAVADLWGGAYAAEELRLRDGVARYRAGIPPIIIWHGDIDPLVHYQNAVDIAANYSAVGAEAELHECVGQKHDAWRCKTAEGLSIDERTIEFFADKMGLTLL